jgi:cysteine-rich repeat protein
MWDADTGVPLRLWGRGIDAPGAVADPAIAEAAAQQFLAQHLATLAPGAVPSDFVVIGNREARGIRSVGFEQRKHGLRVVGGAIGITFKHDRIVMVSSTALPFDHDAAAGVSAGTRLPATTISRAATGWLAQAGYLTTARTVLGATAAERVIVPIVRPARAGRRDISYRVAEQVRLDAADGVPGMWDVWIDAASGDPIVRTNRLHFGTGKVMYDVPDRYPMGGRSGHPALFATHSIGGAGVTSTVDGSVTWNSTGGATVSPGLRGPFVAISNAGGSLATGSLTLATGGTATWTQASSETADAQLSAFVHANIAKQFARTRLDPTLGWLDDTISVSVNEGSTCNAYSTGDDIHFYRKGNGCENTGRMADVVYHEFGHSLHNNAIIPGVGQWDGALSEGMSDVLAMLITGDHGMGRGFFLSDAPMRDLDNDKRWPDDTTGEVHDDGEIIGGAMWHVRQALEAKLGAAAGYEKTLDIYYSIIARASDIPSSYAEALVADDDDGDLANGTPNQCELNTAFKNHGLADGVVTAGISAPLRTGFNVALDVAPPSGDCPGPEVTGVALEWKLRGGQAERIDLVQTGTTFEAAIPTQPEGSVVQYRVTATLANGSSVAYPNNAADPFYEFYVGYTAPIKCADFESATDWTHGGTGDDWEAGEPLGLGNDPKTAFAGSGVFGTDLTKDGAYGKQIASFAESGDIDLEGHTDARLHLRRWLAVEDGFYDHARILINGEVAWENFASTTEPQQSGVNHVDREWRFQDIELAPYAATGKVNIRFELASDEGLQLGGWTLDDVCVVHPSAAPANCGDGTLQTDQGEVCDDGNLDGGDGCSATCQDETTMPPGGEDGAGDGEGGCCSSTRDPAGALVLAGLTLGILIPRRRRRV